MATLTRFKQTTLERQNRYFSEEFKKQKVREIEKNLCSVAEISNEYEVTRAAIYKWIYKYSVMRKKGIKQVIESESDTKKIKALKEQVKELERALGRKQLMVDFQSKVIDLAEEEYQIDIKKKFGGGPFSGSGTIEDSTK